MKKNQIRKDQIKIVVGAFGNGPPERCVGIVEKVEAPKSGGIFTKYMGCNYLFKGYPDVRIVDSVYAAKRIFSGTSLLISEKWIRFLLSIPVFIFLLLPKKIKMKILIPFWDYFLNIGYQPMRRYILPQNRYSKSIAELNRAVNSLFKKIKDPVMASRIKRTGDIICMSLEYDYTYRARFQDFFPCLDKEALKKNPIKEMNRLLDIFWEREIGIRRKLKGAIRFLKILMKHRRFRNFVVKLLLEIDLEKIKFDKDDWYYVLDRTDYNYGGLSHEERMKISEKMDKEAKNKRPKIKFKKEEDESRTNTNQ
jgi:hypothetical protein